VPGLISTGCSCPTSEQARGAITSSLAPGLVSAWSASSIPRTLRLFKLTMVGLVDCVCRRTTPYDNFEVGTNSSRRTVTPRSQPSLANTFARLRRSKRLVMFKAIHPIIGTRDINRAIAFYTEKLGLLWP
jgi:hypothetical protein